MAQNSQSATASRNTVPGTANPDPISPVLFTSAPRRDYVPDAKRVQGVLATPELDQARGLYEQGDFAACRAEAKRILKDKATSADARMEAGDLLDRTDLDHGPIATAVAFLILFALMMMFVTTSGH
jgi:hypothetical protein